ncbi:unnamed protein product [Didymodactylos carnosus]|uniref:Uncharacterized protein n=1 Tax=Didymodactylos carnosus TaxID=1234261 RepID=A0A814SZT8_9BILA|nr:unnamed protein product [Didymodactylos carnosus]CAF3914928.1 unnamed protein product [Didymodactylos carnosus]
MYACQYSTINMVQLLIDLGGNVSVKDNDGQTLLHYAAQSMLNADVTLFLLMTSSIDPDATTVAGYTALDLCMLSDIDECIISFNGYAPHVLESFRDNTVPSASDMFEIKLVADKMSAQLLNEIVQEIGQMNDR